MNLLEFIFGVSEEKQARINKINIEARIKMKEEGLCLMCCGSGTVQCGSAECSICPQCKGAGKK